MTKPREKTREEVTAEIEDGKKKIRQLENREKVLRQKLSQEERRTRSHRLIVRGALGGVLRYTQQDGKTLWEGQRLVTGWNCTAQSALSEMLLTKERFRKTDGRQYYHFVQSFAETDDLTPQEAHAIALELAQREFPNFEVLVWPPT